MIPLSKSYYNSKNNLIFIDKDSKNKKLDYFHEEGHKYIEYTANISILEQIAVFILLFSIIFCKQYWQIAAFIFWFGLQIIDEGYAWIYAYKKLKQYNMRRNKHGKK